MSIIWNSIRLGGRAHGIVTKTVHKSAGGGGVPGSVGSMHVRIQGCGSRGVGCVAVQRVLGSVLQLFLCT